jgi:putative transposase
MRKQRHSAEQIIGKLREAEVLQGKGMSMEEVVRQLGVSKATYYKWRKEYGGLHVDHAMRLKELADDLFRCVPSFAHARLLLTQVRKFANYFVDLFSGGMPIQNGRKVSSKIGFEVVKKVETSPVPPPENGNGRDHGFKEPMEKCVQDAVDIVKEANTIPWQNDDIRSIALTMFIQRARA